MTLLAALTARPDQERPGSRIVARARAHSVSAFW